MGRKGGKTAGKKSKNAGHHHHHHHHAGNSSAKPQNAPRHKHADPNEMIRKEEVEELIKIIENGDGSDQEMRKRAPKKTKQPGEEMGKVGMTKAQLQMVKLQEEQRRAQQQVPAKEVKANTKGTVKIAQQTSACESEEEEEEEEEGAGSEDEDYSDTANEKQSEYRKGGYHRVEVGELYANRYRVLQKLGWGYFSTVWLVWDYSEERFQAMKVQKSAKEYNDAALDEIELLSQIRAAESAEAPHCAQLNDFFHHNGPNGNHVCMVFDVYGENLLSLIERYEYRGIPLPIVKCITKQILIALEHIHSVEIIHTDLKPENVLLSTPKHSIISLMRRYHPPPLHQQASLTGKDLKSMTKSQRRRYFKKIAKEREKQKQSVQSGLQSVAQEKNSIVNDNDEDDAASDGSKTDQEWEVERFHHVILADFGNSCWTYKQFATEVQTRQYRCPEVILGEPYSTPIDLWSLGCMIFELITGDFLFNPQKGDGYSRDEDHLALISELLGELPEKMRLGSGTNTRYFYNSKGQLRNIKDMEFWDLKSLLESKYHFKEHKAKEISEFLLPMLECDPKKRATAKEMLDAFNDFFVVDEDDYDPRDKKKSKKNEEAWDEAEEQEDTSDDGGSNVSSASSSSRSSNSSSEASEDSTILA